MIERCAACGRRRFDAIEGDVAEFQRRRAKSGVRSTCFTIGDAECHEVAEAIETMQRAGLWIDQEAVLDRIVELQLDARFERDLAEEQAMGADC